MKRTITKGAIALTFTSLLYSGLSDTSVRAQESESRIGSILEEVVVTARKREEDVQDIPLAVSAFTGESLEARGITSISEVGRITPNVNYQNNPGISGSSSVSTVYIRGIGQRDFLGTIDNGTGFYIDDVVVARSVGAVVDLLDVDRVEVLRGPQGTLNGRNNIGGAIKLHSKKPDANGGGYVDLRYGTDNLISLKGSTNFALGEKSAASVSALFKTQDGYVDRPAGGDLGGSEVFAVRAAVLFEPTDSLTINLSADFSREDDDGPAFTLIESGATTPGSFAGFYNNLNSGEADCAGAGGPGSANPLCYNNNYTSTDTNLGTAPTFSDTVNTGITANIVYDVSDTVSLRSITGYRDLDAQFARDTDASPLTIVHFFDDFVTEQFSQEFQLNANLLDDKLDFVTGLYYFDEDGNNLNELDFAIARFTSGSAFATESKALYMQATYHATDRLDITLGGRYTDEDKSFFPDQTVGPNFIGIPYLDASGACVAQDRGGMGPAAPIVSIPAAACPVRQLPNILNERNSSEFTPTVNVAYDVSDETMVYFNYSEGFRSGGFAQRIFPPLPFAPDFGPEFVDSFEVGVKYRNDNVTFNAAAFFTDYTDIQVAAESPGFIGLFEDNIGDAEISGIELETTFNPSVGLFVEFAYGYTNAEYTAIRVEPPLISNVNLDDSFDHVPEHSLSAALTKEFDLNGGAAVIARLEATHTTEYANDADNSALIFTPEVTLVNASFRWLSASDKYIVSAGVKNLTDEEYIQSGYLAESIGLSDVVRDRGLQFYLSGRINF